MSSASPRSFRARERSRKQARSAGNCVGILPSQVHAAREALLSGDPLPASELNAMLHDSSVLGGLLYNQRTPTQYIQRLAAACPQVPWQALIDLTMCFSQAYLSLREQLPNEQAIVQAVVKRDPGLRACLYETADLPIDLLAATLSCPSWLVQVARWAFTTPKTQTKPVGSQDWPGYQAWQALTPMARSKAFVQLWTQYGNAARIACHLGISSRTLREHLHSEDHKASVPFEMLLPLNANRNKASAGRRRSKHQEWLEGLQQYETLAEYAHVENITVAAASARAKVVGHKPSNPKRPAELREFNAGQVVKTIELYGLPDCQRHTTGWWAGIAFRLQRDENTKQFDQYALRLVRQALVDNGFVLLPGSNNNKRWGKPELMTQEEVEQIVSK